jgi:hypothetical protein
MRRRGLHRLSVGNTTECARLVGRAINVDSDFHAIIAPELPRNRADCDRAAPNGQRVCHWGEITTLQLRISPWAINPTWLLYPKAGIAKSTSMVAVLTRLRLGAFYRPARVAIHLPQLGGLAALAAEQLALGRG